MNDLFCISKESFNNPWRIVFITDRTHDTWQDPLWSERKGNKIVGGDIDLFLGRRDKNSLLWRWVMCRHPPGGGTCGGTCASSPLEVTLLTFHLVVAHVLTFLWWWTCANFLLVGKQVLFSSGGHLLSFFFFDKIGPVGAEVVGWGTG